MRPQMSTATVALAVAVMATGLPDVADARPMHAAIVSKYHRYLEEKETISAELDDWLQVYGPKGPKKGWLPVTESRSMDDDLEDQRQRFYLTKEQIMEAREANPMAEFSTQGPFTLMTMEEFKNFLSNSHVQGEEKTNPPAAEKPKTLSENEDNTVSTEGPKKTSSKSNDTKKTATTKNTDKSNGSIDTKPAKTWAPATEGPTVIAAMRRLRIAGKSQYAFDGGDYSADGQRGYTNTADTYTQTTQPTYESQSSQQTYESQSSQQTYNGQTWQQNYESQSSQQNYQSNTANAANSGNNGGNNNGGWNFGDVSTGDSAQVAGVSGGSGSNYGYNNGNQWWGANGWGGSSNWWGQWGNWGNGGSNAGTQWTQPPGSWNSQWTPPSQSNNDNQWTEPPSSDQVPATQSPPAPQPPAPAPPTPEAEPPVPATQPPAPATQPPAPATQPPAPAPPATPAPSPKTKAPATAAPAPPATPAPAPKTKAPATAAPAPAAKKETANKDNTDAGTARDSDSNSVDWSKSACVNPPGLQGQCGSCWAFATVGALEAAQCIANGDKKAPTYSPQQLVSCDTKDYGCNGGAPVYAMEYVRDNGICTESSYPYTSVDGGTAAACANKCKPAKSGITEIAQLTAGDESALLSALKKQPVIVSVVSDNTAWKQYTSGVITSCDTTTVDHAVLAVGFDATTIKIKNSWGTDWGEDGYVRISRSTKDMGTCAVLTDMSYPKL